MRGQKREAEKVYSVRRALVCCCSEGAQNHITHHPGMTRVRLHHVAAEPHPKFVTLPRDPNLITEPQSLNSPNSLAVQNKSYVKIL